MRDVETRYLPTPVAIRQDGDGVKLGGYALRYMKLSQNLGGFVEQIAHGALTKTLRDGGDGTAAYPHVAHLPAAAPAVPHGIVPRLTSLVARIKAARNYSDDIGKELNIIGAAQIVDTDGAKPIDGAQFFTRLGQRIIHMLTTQTNSGQL